MPRPVLNDIDMVAGINSNEGDTATITRVTVSTSSGVVVCGRYQGVAEGSEPKCLGEGWNRQQRQSDPERHRLQVAAAATGRGAHREVGVPGRAAPAGCRRARSTVRGGYAEAARPLRKPATHEAVDDRRDAARVTPCGPPPRTARPPPAWDAPRRPGRAATR
ncbi:hypothetical protein Ate01nite_37560 [Actinoplanes teichomyceticus]|nr:hypothetical protein Ate01nite_37560 [Actinoplanes teichomyceticus]